MLQHIQKPHSDKSKQASEQINYQKTNKQQQTQTTQITI